ncbi:MAG: OsmC family peroxiredoxin [Puniceicoccaceae bacterium]|nr:MAG: OsmC family peroxiredoxin [Puniceicoccaceae bacterium]
MVKVTAEYLGHLHCSVNHGPSGHSFETDAPVDNQGKGELFSPTDLVGAAMASCMLTIMGIAARHRSLAIEGAWIEISKEMTTSGPRRIKRLATEIWIPLPRSADPDGILEKAALGCPVHRSLHPEVEKPVSFHWAGEPA